MQLEEVVEVEVAEAEAIQHKSLHNLVVNIGNYCCSHTKQSCSSHRSRYNCGSCCTVVLEVEEVEEVEEVVEVEAQQQ
jgi:hypothetical protein